jgi:hypothetical protein
MSQYLYAPTGQFYQPVGGWIFKDPKNFDEQVKAIGVMADEMLNNPLPATMDAQTAVELIADTVAIGAELSKVCNTMRSDITNAFVLDTISISCNTHLNYNRKYISPLFTRATRARSAGEEVSTEGFARNLSGYLRDIQRTYEALNFLEGVKPFLIRNMPWTMAQLAKIGAVWIEVVDFAKEGLKVVQSFADVASGIGDMFGKMIKLSMYAGGAFLFYWLFVKKDKKKKT